MFLKAEKTGETAALASTFIGRFALPNVHIATSIVMCPTP